jgi:hypothetical protein
MRQACSLIQKEMNLMMVFKWGISFITLNALFWTTCVAQNSSYRIEQTELRIEPDFAGKVISVAANIVVQNPARETEFTFGLNDRYEDVRVTANASPSPFRRRDGELTVTVEHPTEQVTLAFALKGKLGASSDERCEIVSDSSLFLLWSDRFYPIDFGRWSPLKTEIVLPRSFQVIAPGRMTKRENKGAQVLSTFESSNPIVSASIFADARWIVTEREINGLRMRTLLFPQSQSFSEQIFKSSSEIIGYFSELLCPYPFDEFSFVTIQGMYARRAFPGFVGYEPKYLQKEFTTTGHDAHETSLLWWTYTLHGSGPGSFQWTEGFGDYVELLYDEEFHKPIPAIFQRFHNEYLATPGEQDLLYKELRGSTAQKLIHGKYPWLMHLLRGVIGDRPFRAALKLLFQEYRYRTFSMDQFVSTLEKGSGQSLQWWREEWLERKGRPAVAFSSTVENQGGHFLITCVLDQQGALYHLPLEIGIKTTGGLQTKTVSLTDRHMTFTFGSPEEPQRILLDPRGWIPMNVISVR